MKIKSIHMHVVVTSTYYLCPLLLCKGTAVKGLKEHQQKWKIKTPRTTTYTRNKTTCGWKSKHTLQAWTLIGTQKRRSKWLLPLKYFAMPSGCNNNCKLISPSRGNRSRVPRLRAPSAPSYLLPPLPDERRNKKIKGWNKLGNWTR